jgi:hypothetical protein
MSLIKSVNSFADKALNRLVGSTTASAGCPPDSWNRCVVNGVCSSGHSKERCSTNGACVVTCTHIGCC